ncbi:hypothetical protein [Mesorhizobium delmotii]|uniref:hypothetical protein n=1 Tax=Mesorhizobium delmotii TaxID=1631247 RepID=UPI001FCEAD4A|nr:hypothetical protein [Mesorhizobium delmotii]
MRVEIAIAEKPGQEFGLVAGWIEVQSSPFHDRVDNSLTAVADESDSVLAAAFQCEDERGCGHCDDDTKRESQRSAYRDAARMQRRCFLTAIGSSLCDACRSRPGKQLPGQNPSQFRTNNGHPTISELRARERADCSPGYNLP